MKEKQKAIALIVLLAIAAVIWYFAWNKESGGSQQSVALDTYKLLAVENPQIHWAELKRAQQTEYKTNGRNPFSVIKPAAPRETSSKAAQDLVADTLAAPNPKPLPPPPPLQPAQLPANMKYFGYGTVPSGSPRRAFFTDGDDIYIVPEGEILLGRFRILKVGNTNVEFQEISNGNHGSAPLEEPPASLSASAVP